MNTLSKPYSPAPTDSARLVQSAETLSDTARSALDSVKGTIGDAVDRGQAAVSQAGAAATDMAGSATQQAKTIASELETIIRRNPLGMVAGAAMAGVLIGLLGGRRR